MDATKQSAVEVAALLPDGARVVPFTNLETARADYHRTMVEHAAKLMDENVARFLVTDFLSNMRHVRAEKRII